MKKMIIFILPLIWNVVSGSPVWGTMPVLTIEVIRESYPSSFNDLGIADFISNVLTSSINPEQETLPFSFISERRSESVQETKKSLDNTIEFLQKIRAQFSDENKETRDSFFTVGKEVSFVMQSLPSPIMDIRSTSAPEESEESPIPVVVATLDPEATENSDKEQTGNENASSTDAQDVESGDAASDILSFLFNTYFSKDKMNPLGEKVGKEVSFLMQSLPSPIMDIRSTSAPEESEESPIPVVVVTLDPEATETSDNEQTGNENASSTDAAQDVESGDAVSDILSFLFNTYFSKDKMNPLGEKTTEDDQRELYTEKLEDTMFEMTNEI